jgi:hypothetical protein
MHYARRLDHLAAASSSAVGPHAEQARANMGIIDPATDHNARIPGYNLFKSLLASLADLAQPIS